MKKYFEIFKFNLKMQTAFKANYIFKIISFTLHIFVFSSLWDYLLKDKLILGYSKSELIWFVIIGEFIIYTTSHNYTRISEMVKNGDIANMLTKPVNFVLYLMAEELSTLVKVIFNFILAITLGILMAGFIELSIIKLILVILSMLFGILMIILIEVAIGLLAFVTEENEPFYLIISKAMLILVFVPVEFFSKGVQNVLWVLPTTYVAYAPAKIFVHFDKWNALSLITGQIISLVVIILIVKLLGKKGVENINVNGG